MAKRAQKRVGKKRTAETMLAHIILDELMKARQAKVQFIDIENRLETWSLDQGGPCLRGILTRPRHKLPDEPQLPDEPLAPSESRTEAFVANVLRSPTVITIGVIGQRQPSLVMMILLRLVRQVETPDSTLDWSQAELFDNGVAGQGLAPTPTGLDPVLNSMATALTEMERHFPAYFAHPFILRAPSKQAGGQEGRLLVPATMSLMDLTNLVPYPRRAASTLERKALFHSLIRVVESKTVKLRDWAAVGIDPLEMTERWESAETVRRAGRIRSLAVKIADLDRNRLPDEDDFLEAWESVRRVSALRPPIPGYSTDHPDRFFSTKLWAYVCIQPNSSKDQETKFKANQLSEARVLDRWVRDFARFQNDPEHAGTTRRLAWDLLCLSVAKPRPGQSAVPPYPTLAEFKKSALGQLAHQDAVGGRSALDQLVFAHAAGPGSAIIQLPKTKEKVKLATARAALRLRECVEILAKGRNSFLQNPDLWEEAWEIRRGAKLETAPAIPKFKSFEALKRSHIGWIMLKGKEPRPSELLATHHSKEVARETWRLVGLGLTRDRAYWAAVLRLLGPDTKLETLDGAGRGLEDIIRQDGYPDGLPSAWQWLHAICAQAGIHHDTAPIRL